MGMMRAAQVARPGGPFELVEREIPEPGPGMVRLRVEACGICHSDVIAREALFPGVTFPRIPGHEVAGVVEAVGPGVAGWEPGRRAGVGWHGGSCLWCDSCKRGDFFACPRTETTGITFDGGYATHMIAPAPALARIPDGVSAVEAAPLMCAGITTFNALRNSGARPGQTVAILGLGGLGHLAVQFAARMGFRTIAIARGAGKGPLAKTLGASHYIDSRAGDPAAALTALGGASVILSTVTNADAMSAVLGGLAARGTMVVVGAADSMQVPVVPLLMGNRSVKGWYSGTSIDTQDTLEFAVLAGVRSMNEVYPLSRAGEAYDRMMSGDARFRVVLDMNG